MTTATKTRKKQQTADERREAMAQRRAMLKEVAEAMALAMELDPLVAEQVRAVAEATGYTERNASLIVGQCPAASVVKSFKGWKAEGRAVRKGEKALWILASTARRTVGAPDEMTQEAPEPTEAEGQDGDGDGETKARQRFVTVPVFDVSQTDPIPEDEDEGDAEQ